MTASGYKPLNKNTLVGVFDLTLDSGIVLYGMMLMKKNDSQWVSFPGKPIIRDGQASMKDGKQEYAKLADIPDRARRDAFNAQVIAALKEAGHIPSHI